MTEIRCARPSDPALASLLELHPQVAFSDQESHFLEFDRGSWHRTLGVGKPAGEAYGLPELMDNNPLVCASSVTVPPPATTLALVALGPLFRAGIVLEAPIVQTNAPLTDGDAGDWWLTAGWNEDVDLIEEPRDMGTVLAAQAMAIVPTMSNWDEIDGLYEEAFGRTFYVRRDEASEWHASLVLNKPHAVYRLRLSPDEPHSLLTIQVMADLNGKCGAAQIVHTMNVMAGFEECLGIPDLFSVV